MTCTCCQSVVWFRGEATFCQMLFLWLVQIWRVFMAREGGSGRVKRFGHVWRLRWICCLHWTSKSRKVFTFRWGEEGLYLFYMKVVQKYTIIEWRKWNIYITANTETNNKIHFVITKQSLRTITISHTEQFSQQHTNSIENRGRRAVIHMLKHEFLIDNCHLMSRVPNKIDQHCALETWYICHLSLHYWQFCPWPW